MLNRLKDKLFSEISSPPPSLQSTRFSGLDGLRAVAIIMVIVGHLNMDGAYAPYFNGIAGVKIFFVLSGFLITTLLLKEKCKTGSISLRQFYIRRFLRIIPLVVLYLTVLIILNYVDDLQVGPVPLASALFFFQNIPIPGFNRLNWYVGHFWSLSVEEQFYLTFPFLLNYNLNKYIKTIIISIVCVSVIALLGYNNVGVIHSNKVVHKMTFVVINLWVHTVSILIGSLTSILLFKRIIKVPDSPLLGYLSIALFIIAVLVHTDGFAWSWQYSTIFLFPMLIAAVIVLNLNPSGVFTRILEFPVLKYIGTISYSLYIWQQPFSRPGTSILHTSSISLRLLVIFAAGIISYHCYEVIFIKLKAKFERVKT